MEPGKAQNRRTARRAGLALLDMTSFHEAPRIKNQDEEHERRRQEPNIEEIERRSRPKPTEDQPLDCARISVPIACFTLVGGGRGTGVAFQNQLNSFKGKPAQIKPHSLLLFGARKRDIGISQEVFGNRQNRLLGL